MSLENAIISVKQTQRYSQQFQYLLTELSTNRQNYGGKTGKGKEAGDERLEATGATEAISLSLSMCPRVLSVCQGRPLICVCVSGCLAGPEANG